MKLQFCFVSKRALLYHLNVVCIVKTANMDFSQASVAKQDALKAK